MRDDAAKILVYILLASVALGLLTLGGHYLLVGKPYSAEHCLATNVRAGFYPYNPPHAVSSAQAD